LVRIKDVKVSEGGWISFTVPERYIYRERPTNLEEIEQRKKTWDGGLTRFELKFRGRLRDGDLVLQCIADPCECPEDVMVFSKDRWIQK
jgi:hypothetical protein